MGYDESIERVVKSHTLKHLKNYNPFAIGNLRRVVCHFRCEKTSHIYKPSFGNYSEWLGVLWCAAVLYGWTGC